MSTLDENTQVAEEKTGKDGSGGLMILSFFVGFVFMMVIGWVVFPWALYAEKKQPIDFNHRLHVEDEGMDCESCHFFRDDGTYAGVPKLEQCTDCHEEIMGSAEDENGNPTNEAIFVEEYVVKEREVPWLIYSKQPDCVFFSHVAHVKKAGMDCVTCHGPIGESETLKPYKYNRITGESQDIWGPGISGIAKNSWDRMKMDTCADCHAEAKMAPSSVQTNKDACFVCHK